MPNPYLCTKSLPLTTKNYPILDRINSPADLRKLSSADLVPLSAELREFILDIVSVKGGHLSASLGVAELTIALHYVLDTPQDQLVWDVGHQAYGHKILTGRKDIFHRNRKLEGLSGFPRMAESEYDAFGTGHSSTSISAITGMAMASRLMGDKRKHVAVIGDGALTGGMAYEALNHAGSEDLDILVIINDNSVSIDENVGALKDHLAALKGNPSALDRLFGKGKNFFENLKFSYSGPVDGHDLESLVPTLRKLTDQPGPKVLHCVTRKGKGYRPAEEGDATTWHAPGLFNKETGEIIKLTPPNEQPPRYQEVFGHTIVELAEKNERIVGITPAMPSGSSLNIMMKAMPDRAFDVGIAEQHAVTFAAGLATQGMLPFCNVYSSFLQRAYDQVIHDVALQGLKVIFCLDRAGLVGEDGATHHGAYDMAYLRTVPNMTIAAPMDEVELRNLMYTAQLDKVKGPIALRYPRGRGINLDWKKPFKLLRIGEGRRLRNGDRLAILSIGAIGQEVLKAMDGLGEQGDHVAHFDLRFAKPLDELMLHDVFGKYDSIMTVEDGSLQGGVGSAVLEFMARHGYNAEVTRLGIPDEFVEQGSQKELRALCGLTSEKIGDRLLTILSKMGSEGQQTA